MAQMLTIIVIDREKSRAATIADAITATGDCSAKPMSLDQLKQMSGTLKRHDAVFAGMSDSGQEGDEVINAIRAETLGIPIVAYGSGQYVSAARGRRQNDVLAYLSTPLDKADIRAVLEKISRRKAPKGDANVRRPQHLCRSLNGESAAIERVKKLIHRVAPTDSSVMITGESGTGKEVVARNIHYHSSRKDQSFVPINCASIPTELIESELFGHEKGAFTGAVSARKGRFELAKNGTLFLDEIGDMPLSAQTKLLRVIQERTFERVGGERSIEADVRIIAATHCDFEEQIEEKLFRQDLYYRLNVFPIEMPPLRERQEDIPQLIEELSRRMEFELGLNVRFSERAIDCMKHHRWNGNVRELGNVIERLAILYPDSTVEETHLPKEILKVSRDSGTGEQSASTAAKPLAELPQEGLDLRQHLQTIEKNLIEQALECTDGVVAQAASLLRVGRSTLSEKMRRYGAPPDHGR